MPKLNLKDIIRTIPDFPKPGIMYRDITTLLAHPRGVKQAVEDLSAPYAGQGVDFVAGIEARGFVFGAAIALELGAGFIPIRKSGKLPFDTFGEDYALEYGTDRLEIHIDAFPKEARILVIDDLIATGGTAMAAIKLLRRAGGMVVGAGFVIDLPDLGGAQKIKGLDVPVTVLMEFDGH